jgi:lysozyme family protein
MKANYPAAFEAMQKHEGGYVNHPRDPGGATNRGVIQRVYDGYRERRGLEKRSVKFIEDAEVRDIYRAQYWNAVRGDELPSGIDYCVFDFGVNSGPSRAVKFLQAALEIKQDGLVGEATLAAAARASSRTVIETICRARMSFLRGLPTWKTFGKGWTSRVEGVQRLALRLAAEPSKLPPPDTEPDRPPPAPVAPRGLLKAIIDLILAIFSIFGRKGK